MTKVSVLVPIYNVENYLHECLQSLAVQTLKDIEIICINDGSSDGSLSIAESFSDRDPRFKVIDKPNSGYGDSMNVGMRAATGQYIGILESDDWAEPFMFERLYKTAEKHLAEIVKGEFFEFYSPESQSGEAERRKSSLLLDHETNRVLSPRNNIHIFFQQPSIWSAIYSRAFLAENGIEFTATPGASYQDTAFSFKVFASAERVVFIKDGLLHYRQDNLTSSINDSGKIFAVAEEYAEIERFLNIDAEENFSMTKLMRATRWGAYRWNISRLEPELARQFILFASNQYRQEHEQGDFDFAYCDANFTREISALIHDPELVAAKRKAQQAATVSVIVPAFNVVKTLKSSLDSLLGQTLTDIEILVIDDGSTDGSVELIEQYFKSDPRINVFCQQNAGLSSARNTGIALARAPFVAFLDSDDEFEPDALERLLSAYHENECDLVVGSSEVIFEDDRLTAIQKSDTRNYLKARFRGIHTMTPDILRWTDVHVWNKLFRMEIIRKFNLSFPEGVLYEDALFFNAYAWNVNSVYFLNSTRPIHKYLRRAGTIMDETSLTGHGALDHLKIAFGLLAHLDSPGLREKFGTYYLGFLSVYIRLTLDLIGKANHEIVWRKVRRFVWEERKLLKQLDKAYFEEIYEMSFPVRWMRSFAKVPFLGPAVLKLIVSRHA